MLKETRKTSIMMVFLVMNLMVLVRRKAKAYFVSLTDTIDEIAERLKFIPMGLLRAA